MIVDAFTWTARFRVSAVQAQRVLAIRGRLPHLGACSGDRLSKRATAAVTAAEELAVSAISWFELAWLVRNERITTTIPIRSWLEELAAEVRTVGITPAIADTAVSLPSSFPGDPVDRLIYATAIEHGWRLVTKDKKLRRHRHPRPVAVW